jgi:Fur family transcriptional regulator, ferric uptake regulator
VNTVRPERTLRGTRQGSAIETVLESSDDFRTAQDLHAQLRAQGVRVGLTTVYRHLQRLVGEGAVDAVRTGTGEVAYRLCGGKGHHHHLVCKRCGRVVDIDGPTIEAWMRRVALDSGFVDIEHTVELTGTCRDCAGIDGGGTLPPAPK